MSRIEITNVQSFFAHQRTKMLANNCGIPHSTSCCYLIKKIYWNAQLTVNIQKWNSNRTSSRRCRHPLSVKKQTRIIIWDLHIISIRRKNFSANGEAVAEKKNQEINSTCKQIVRPSLIEQVKKDHKINQANNDATDADVIY